MAKGRPAGLRLETAVRTQIEFQQSSLDDLLSFDHRARQVWDYVEELDLSALYGRVQTTVSSSGRPAIDPAILVSLWLYATLEAWAARGCWTVCAIATLPTCGCSAG